MPRVVRVAPGTDPGFRRVRSGRGFRYVDSRGAGASSADRKRIRNLAIPPSWEGVWVSAEARGHIQAIGVDAAGRRQYLYHRHWRESHDRHKFDRALELAERLPRARAQVTRGLHGDGLSPDRVLAAGFRLLDAAAPRIGSVRYLTRHGSRGLTTLRRRDVHVDGALLTLSFPAKSGRRALITIDDVDLAAVVAELAAGRPRARLLSPFEGRRRVSLTPAAVNEYVRALTGGAFTAKDFRTLRGTIVAAEALAGIGIPDTDRERKGVERLAVHASAAALGNTPAVARASYIDPRVFREYRRGELLDLGISPESAIRRLILGQ